MCFWTLLPLTVFYFPWSSSFSLLFPWCRGSALLLRCQSVNLGWFLNSMITDSLFKGKSPLILTPVYSEKYKVPEKSTIQSTWFSLNYWKKTYYLCCIQHPLSYPTRVLARGGCPKTNKPTKPVFWDSMFYHNIILNSREKIWPTISEYIQIFL